MFQGDNVRYPLNVEYGVRDSHKHISSPSCHPIMQMLRHTMPRDTKPTIIAHETPTMQCNANPTNPNKNVAKENSVIPPYPATSPTLSHRSSNASTTNSFILPSPSSLPNATGHSNSLTRCKILNSFKAFFLIFCASSSSSELEGAIFSRICLRECAVGVALW